MSIIDSMTSTNNFYWQKVDKQDFLSLEAEIWIFFHYFCPKKGVNYLWLPITFLLIDY